MNEVFFGTVINKHMLIQSKVVNFNKLKLAVEKTSNSWEKLAPEIGMTGNGLRYTFNNKSITVVKYVELCEKMKIHPAFLFMNEEDLSDYMYKKNKSEVVFNKLEIMKLQNEVSRLKEKNSNLHDRLLECMDDLKKK